jgi:hypothetical protein
MAGHSRIKFNPVSREIEVEGSETFVKIYFSKLQALLAGEETMPKERKARKVRKAVAPKKARAVRVPAKKAAVKRVAKKAGKKPGKKTGKRPASALSRIVSALRGTADGLTTTQLREKTGLKQRQIWTTIYRAQKLGKIAKAKRGTYVVV